MSVIEFAETFGLHKLEPYQVELINRYRLNIKSDMRSQVVRARRHGWTNYAELAGMMGLKIVNKKPKKPKPRPGY